MEWQTLKITLLFICLISNCVNVSFCTVGLFLAHIRAPCGVIAFDEGCALRTIITKIMSGHERKQCKEDIGFCCSDRKRLLCLSSPYLTKPLYSL